MLPKPLRFLWGDLTNEELKKFGILSAAMMLIIGNYWMLRTTKNAVFDMFVGFRQYQPIVKMISLFVMIFLVLVYSKLVDLMKKQHLIYLFCVAYSILFILIGYAIANPQMATMQPTSFFYPLFSWIPGSIIGWISYVLLESYGSLLIALFYAFIASVMTTESAKKGYGMLFFLTQIGTITGSFITAKYSTILGLDKLYIFGGLIILIAPFIIMFYTKVIPQQLTTVQKLTSQKTDTGFLEGLKILLTRPYVMGILVVATIYEIIGTIVEYQMNWIASGLYTTAGEFATFNAYLGIGINSLALIFALVGTSYFMRNFGLKFCLMAFPVIIGTIIITTFFFYYSGIAEAQLMWTLLAAMIAIKGFSYTLNKPSSEVLYIPTTKDIKFKSKSWIDSFGGRSTKGIGALASNSLKYSLPALMIYGSLISLGIVGVWIVIAALTGKKFQQLQEDNSFVE
ncbi:MAG: Npt1/Npt2 family nucleotide transporter [bacterium]